MKNLLHCLTFLSLLSFFISESSADKPIKCNNNGIINDVSWTPLQLGIWPGLQLFGSRNTCGFSGFLLAESSETNNYGIQTAPFTLRDSNYGLNLAIFSLAGKNYGAQLALINYGKINRGASFGLCTDASKNEGMQFGLYNAASSRSNTGTQIGLFNHAESGFQLGLLNCNPKANLKYLPFFNYLPPLAPGDGIPVKEQKDPWIRFLSVSQLHDKLVLEAIIKVCLDKKTDYSQLNTTQEYRKILEIPLGQWWEFHLLPPGEVAALNRQFRIDGENVDLKYAPFSGIHLKLFVTSTGPDSYVVKGVGIEFIGTTFHHLYQIKIIITGKQISDQSSMDHFYTDEELQTKNPVP